MMDRALFIILSVLLVVSATLPVFAGSKKKKATPAQYQAPVIANVTGNTITVNEETARTITQFTEINVNGQRAAVADLKPGMTASVTIGVDPTRASRINATGCAGGRAAEEGRRTACKDLNEDAADTAASTNKNALSDFFRQGVLRGSFSGLRTSSRRI
jgi:hypothetical protein